mgnify:CR=1 FL=1
MMNLEKITDAVITIAQKAGNFIKTERQSFDSSKIEFKGHHSNLVSYVDKETEKMLVKELQLLIPEAGFITEEATIKQEKKDYCWIIDPLDGTTNFMHDLPLYSVSIGLMHKDEVVSGVIYDVMHNETFSAWKGGGAYCNTKKIKSSPATTLTQTLLATGFPYYKFEKMEEYLNILKELMKHCQGLRRCGSAAIDLAWVAAGRFDGYFEFNINAWDIAAGCLIVEEAGGITTDFKGGSEHIFGKNIVAGSAGIHAEFLEIVKRNWFSQ